MTSTPVVVEFTLDADTWNKVVVETGDDDEIIVDVEELSDKFLVEYESEESWACAQVRFKGLIEYTLCPHIATL